MSDAVTQFLASKGVTVPEEVIAHYGTPGMKWGRRKNRSSSGSPKVATAKSAPPKAPNTFSNRPKNRKMSDAELRAKVNRLQMEKQLKDLTAPTPKADRFAKQVLKEVGKQAVRTIATRAVSAGIEVALGKAAGRAVEGTVSKALLDQMVKGGGKKGPKS